MFSCFGILCKIVYVIFYNEFFSEYAGYDDVYGHSVEESDLCVSPSTGSAFVFPLQCFVMGQNLSLSCCTDFQLFSHIGIHLYRHEGSEPLGHAFLLNVDFYCLNLGKRDISCRSKIFV